MVSRATPASRSQTESVENTSMYGRPAAKAEQQQHKRRRAGIGGERGAPGFTGHGLESASRLRKQSAHSNRCALSDASHDAAYPHDCYRMVMPSARNRARCSSPDTVPAGRLMRPPARNHAMPGQCAVVRQLAQRAAHPARGSSQTGQLGQLPIADHFAFRYLMQRKVQRRTPCLCRGEAGGVVMRGGLFDHAFVPVKGMTGNFQK